MSDPAFAVASRAGVASPTLGRPLPATEPETETALPLAGRRLPGTLVPLFSLFTAIGVLLMALAYSASRAEQASAYGLFWAGLLVTFTPIVVRLLSRGASRTERLALVVLLGMGAYLIKVFYTPLVFTFPDELQHWRTLTDMLTSGTLFEFNPTLRVSPLYPGLEIVTDALVSATGLSPVMAGLAIAGVMRLLLVIGLFLFYEQISGSARVAGLAVTFYAANPNFVYLDGQFAYETFALAMMAFALFVVVRQRTATGVHLAGLTVIGVLASATVVVTHHFSQFVLIGVFGAWMLATFAIVVFRWPVASPDERRRGLKEATQVGLALGATAAAATAWLIGVAQPVIEYLAPNFLRGFIQLAVLIAGAGSVRVPFRNGAGTQAPLPEQLIGYLSILFVLAALPFGLGLIWRHHRLDGGALALAALAIAYPLSLPLRLTDAGSETAGRLPEFLYLGLAFPVALAVARMPRLGLPAFVRTAATAVFTMIVLLGDVFVGWGPPGHIPGGYLVGAAVRSVDEQSLATATWVRNTLGPNNVLTADWPNTLVEGSYGGQEVVSVSNTRQDASQMFWALNLGDAQRQVLRDLNIRYVLVDWRMATALPVSGIYFEGQEPDAGAHLTPIPLQALQKFDDAPGVSRIFDSGSLTIFDVGGVTNVN